MAPLTVIPQQLEDPTTTTDLEVDFDKNVTRLYESISASDWNAAVQDVKSNPDEAKTWVVRHHHDGEEEGIMWRFLPLHSACARQPPESLINTLVSVYPQGAKSVDDQGMLPIHYACGNQASVEVIRILLLANPAGASTKDPNGMLPIHYVAQWGPSSASVINVLVFAYRNIADARDLDGNTPLDLARDAEYPDKDEVIFTLEQLGGGADVDSRQHHEQHEIQHQQPSSRSMNMEQQHSQMSLVEPVMETEPEQVMNSIKSSMPKTMPKTSPAVQRLQEAAAAQRKAREEQSNKSKMQVHDIPSDELQNLSVAGASRTSGGIGGGGSTAMSTRQPSVRSIRSSPSTDDISLNDAGNLATMKMVNSLKNEVNKLRAEAAFAETEAAEKINKEREQMQGILDEMKEKLTKSQQETMDSLAELSTKEEFGQFVEARLQDKESELEAAKKKNAKFHSDIKAMKEGIEIYKQKTSKLEDNLMTLTSSMENMLAEQDMIMTASIRHEEHMKKVALERQQKMQDLIDQEVQFAKQSLEKQKQSDLGSEEMINEALEKQKELISAIVEVLKDSKPVAVE